VDLELRKESMSALLKKQKLNMSGGKSLKKNSSEKMKISLQDIISSDSDK
jgi:hypothetical protein